MIKKCVLIVDKRLELSTKYKKLLEQSKITVIISHELNDAIKNLTRFEPDLIVISDSLDGKLSENCQKIKMLSSNIHSVIVALSKSSHLQDKLDILNTGADDFLSEPIEPEEFKARINAHLRMIFEHNINEKTFFITRNYNFLSYFFKSSCNLFTILFFCIFSVIAIFFVSKSIINNQNANQCMKICEIILITLMI